MESQKLLSNRNYPTWMTFPMTTISGIVGWCCVHPIDLVKVRMNLSGDPNTTIRSTLREIFGGSRGVLGFWEGLSAGIAKQITYATLRLSLFDVFRDYSSTLTGRQANLFERAACGSISGGLAAFLSAPIELSLVRMVGDKRLPIETRRNYKSVIDALVRIWHEEGPKTYWRGSYPTVFRSSLVGCVQVGGYDHLKESLIHTNNYFFSGHLLRSSIIANLAIGFLYSFITMPFETVKNAMMVQQRTNTGQLRHTSIFGTIQFIVRERGTRALWKGYVPYYTRCATFMFITFNLLETLKITANAAWSPK